MKKCLKCKSISVASIPFGMPAFSEELIKDENDKMKWIAEGSIKLEPATNCAQIKDGITNP